jgi:hypothetical protein
MRWREHRRTVRVAGFERLQSEGSLRLGKNHLRRKHCKEGLWGTWHHRQNRARVINLYLRQLRLCRNGKVADTKLADAIEENLGKRGESELVSQLCGEIIESIKGEVHSI